MSFFRSRLFLRIVVRNREVYILKVITLAIAFASSTLIALFALNEFGHDRFHRDAGNVVRILQRDQSENAHGNRLSTRIPDKVYRSLAYAPDSFLVSRVKILEQVTVLADTVKDEEIKAHAVDPSILSIFSFEIAEGEPNDFQKSGTVLLSESSARHYFGNRSAVGKTLSFYTFGDTLALRVAAVYNDFPLNAHENFSVLLHYEQGAIHQLGYDPHSEGVYARILQGERLNHERTVNRLAGAPEFEYRLQPVSEIYFGPIVMGEDARHGDSYSVIILLCITGLILCLAITSFVNLTTLTLPHRSKEIAVKKLAGTSQWKLLLMFARESFIVTAAALITGIGLLFISAGFIAPMLSIRLIPFVIILLGLVVLTGLSPLFLAIRFARATPNRLLGAETITFPRFKRVITIVQLGIGLFLIVSSMVIRRQVNYSLIKEPGRNHYQIVYVNYPRNMTNEDLLNLQVQWNKGRGNPHIDGVIATSQLPDRSSSKELTTGFYSMAVDPAYPTFFDLKMIQGRWFAANDGDSIYVVNRRGSEQPASKSPNAIGVLEDVGSQFNRPEKPLKITLVPYFKYNFLCIRILEVDIRKTVDMLSHTFGSDEHPAVITYANKRFEQWLVYQDRLNLLSEILTLISGLLACCAIYGLSLSMVRDKIKQIAIHKMFGATTFNITSMLLREFAMQSLTSIVIFGPFTFIFLREWLRNFIYTTPFQWLDPVVPLAYCALIITLLCGFQASTLSRKDLTASLKG